MKHHSIARFGDNCFCLDSRYKMFQRHTGDTMIFNFGNNCCSTGCCCGGGYSFIGALGYSFANFLGGFLGGYMNNMPWMMNNMMGMMPWAQAYGPTSASSSSSSSSSKKSGSSDTETLGTGASGKGNGTDKDYEKINDTDVKANKVIKMYESIISKTGDPTQEEINNLKKAYNAVVTEIKDLEKNLDHVNDDKNNKQIENMRARLRDVYNFLKPSMSPSNANGAGNTGNTNGAGNTGNANGTGNTGNANTAATAIPENVKTILDKLKNNNPLDDNDIFALNRADLKDLSDADRAALNKMLTEALKDLNNNDGTYKTSNKYSDLLKLELLCKLNPQLVVNVENRNASNDKWIKGSIYGVEKGKDGKVRFGVNCQKVQDAIYKGRYIFEMPSDKAIRMTLFLQQSAGGPDINSELKYNLDIVYDWDESAKCWKNNTEKPTVQKK